MNYRSEEELNKILKNFDVPELFYKSKEDAGPDEEWVKTVNNENTVEDKGDTFALFTYN